MINIKVMIKNKRSEMVSIDPNNDSINNLISKLKEKLGDITVKLITISGKDIKAESFSDKLSTYDLEEGDYVLISDYYDGGNIYRKYILYQIK